MADIRALTRAEGEALVGYLRAMPEEQWSESTACAPWTVRHLVAHLTAGGNQTFGNFAKGIITAGFNFDKFVNGDLAKYLDGKAGSVFTFGVKGGYDMGVKVVESCELFSHLANIGDTRSLIIHPASTTHRQLTDEQREAAGAGPDVVRVSIGIETADDIIRDLDQALTAAA